MVVFSRVSFYFCEVLSQQTQQQTSGSELKVRSRQASLNDKWVNAIKIAFLKNNNSIGYKRSPLKNMLVLFKCVLSSLC